MSPPGRAGFGMAYDSARGKVVIFGGAGANGFLNDTWEWDGTNWTQKANGPGFLLHVGMAYDAARQQTVLYGGSVGTPFPLANTWVWDGNSWTQKFPANNPGPRSNFRMAYDAARQQIVMFGGWNGSAEVNETWVWDGTNWTQRLPSPIGVPSPRQDFGIAYDSNRQRIVLFSGILPAPSGPPDNNTYEWDGTNWTQDAPAQNPTGNGRGGVSMAYDLAHSQVVMFGGVDTMHVFTDAWVFGAPVSSSCTSGPPPTIRSISPTLGVQGQTITNFTVSGSNFEPTSTISFSGLGVAINSYISRTFTEIVASISVASGAAPGVRDVTVTNSDLQNGMLNAAFDVQLAPLGASPDIGVSPVKLDFGTVAVNSSATRGLFVQNTGTATLTVTETTSTNSAFTVFPSSFTLEPGHVFTVSVTFSPGVAGTSNGVIGIKSNAATSQVFVSVTGVAGNSAATATVGPLILVSSNDSSPNHPLYITATNKKPCAPPMPPCTGGAVVGDVTITNVTGTWYELDLSSSSPSVSAPSPIPAQQIPFAFLIGPFQQLTFKGIVFPSNEYLQLNATRTSVPVFSILAIDLIMRGIFGVTLDPSLVGVLRIDLGVLRTFLMALNTDNNCSLAAITVGTCDSLWCIIEKTLRFLQCTAANPQLRQAIGDLITDLYNSDLATQVIQFGAKSLANLIFLVTHVQQLAILFDQTINADVGGFVRLEARRP